MISIRRSRSLLIRGTALGFAFASLTSCSLAKNAGAELGVSLAPSKAYIVPGKGISCVAAATAKSTGETAIADVSGDRVLFNRFVMQWRSDDKLTIAAIKATIFSTGITGANTPEGLEITLDENETAALLGRQNLTISYASPYPSVERRSVNIDSTDSAKGDYAPCGLHLGGIASVEGLRSYTARIKIEVTGYKTTCVLQTDGSCLDGEQSPVRQTVTVSAEKF